MKVFFVIGEVFLFVKIGGLGDVFYFFLKILK